MTIRRSVLAVHPRCTASSAVLNLATRLLYPVRRSHLRTSDLLNVAGGSSSSGGAASGTPDRLRSRSFRSPRSVNPMRSATSLAVMILCLTVMFRVVLCGHMTKQASTKKSALGQALSTWSSLAPEVEAAFEASEGEETDETRELERLLELSESDLIVALCGYCRMLDAQDMARKDELERLKAVRDRTARARQWAHAKLLEVLGERRSVHAGTFRVRRLRGRESVRVSPHIVLNDVPEKYLRQPPTPPPEVDRKAVRDGYKSGDLPVPGITIELGEDTVGID